MILISFSIALIAIVFGAKLLAQSHKDSLGVLYKYLSWFIMIMGFLVLICDGAQGFLKMCHRGDDGRMMRREFIMRDGDGMMGGGPMWMMHHHGCDMNCDMNCGNSCDGMMHDGCDGMMHDGCNGMMNCKDGGKGSCKDDGMGASCPMMGGMKCKMDSAKMKK